MNRVWERLTDWEKSPVYRYLRNKSAGRELKKLIVELKDGEILARHHAAWALGGIGGPTAVSALIISLGGEDWVDRLRIAEALGEIKDPSAVPALISVLKDNRSVVRMGAAEALGELKDPSAIPSLIDSVNSWDKPVRKRAAEALIKIEPRNYKNLLLLRSAARKARNEGKPTDGFLKVYNEWSKELGKDADEFVSAAKTLPKPRVPRKPDSVERVQLRKVRA